ncbi:MAG: hypothetical protein ACREFJ_11685 [Acetobacteraceae bacterium]
MTSLTPPGEGRDQARAQLRRRHFAHMHPSITAERVAAAVEHECTTLDNPGFCLACGVEPDAEQYACESCGEAAVYGASEILIAIA